MWYVLKYINIYTEHLNSFQMYITVGIWLKVKIN